VRPTRRCAPAGRVATCAVPAQAGLADSDRIGELEHVISGYRRDTEGSKAGDAGQRLVMGSNSRRTAFVRTGEGPI